MDYSFEDFKKRAKDNSLTKWEKIGFPDSYRKGIENSILEDIILKLDLGNSKKILDIGCGCSELVSLLIDFTNINQQELYLVDSKEMLDNIVIKNNSKKLKLIPGKFPDESVLLEIKNELFDSIIVYSVFQYVFIFQNIYDFINHCLKLLKPGGRLLLGDIPNFQTRDRFLKTENGKRFLSGLKDNYKSISLNHLDEERVDDSIIISILMRYRQFGYETYLMPQNEKLPFSNRREDIVIYKR